MKPRAITLPGRVAATLNGRPAPAPGVVVVHGLGSRKENHADYLALLAEHGIAGLALDLPGHGASPGRPGPESLDAVIGAIDALIEEGFGPIGLRGSSFGGLLALAGAARRPRAVGAVVALCPARPESVAARIDDPWPLDIDLAAAVRLPGIARGYWQAIGDEVVPWPQTFRLAQISPSPVRLRVSSRGHHRSLQHDPRVQRATVDFLAEHLGRFAG